MVETVTEVVSPVGQSVYEIISPARRLADLSGKTVCELWDWAFRGDEVFPILRELLAKRYSGIKFVDYTSFGDINGPKQRELINNLSDFLHKTGGELVISGVGA